MAIGITSINKRTVTFVEIEGTDGNDYRVWPDYPENTVEIWDFDTAAFIYFSRSEELRKFLVDAAAPLFAEENNEPYPIA